MVYCYASGRGVDHVQAHLESFSGILQTDGYTAYKGLVKTREDSAPIVLSFCWAHLRRRFYDIAVGGNAPLAEDALHQIAALYKIEEHIRGQSAEQRQNARNAGTRPLVDAFKTWLDATLARVPGRSKLADVIRYAIRHWQGLVHFLDDGRIEIDSNAVERSMRPIAKRVSLCTPYSSVCKHWKCIRVNDATRATFPGHRSFDRLRRKIDGSDLMRCAGHNLHSRKHAGFDKTPYRVVCDA